MTDQTHDDNPADEDATADVTETVPDAPMPDGILPPRGDEPTLPQKLADPKQADAEAKAKDEDDAEDEDAAKDDPADDGPTKVERPSQRPSASSDEKGDSPREGAIRVRYFGQTDVGMVRDHNEDNFTVADLDAHVRDLPDDAPREVVLDQRGVLLAVCDGMGGAAAGEVASQLAVDTIYEVIQGGEPPADRDEFARRLVLAIEEAGSRIFASAKMDRTRRGMGTTATVAGVMDQLLFIGQVGDSRAYILRDGQLGMVSKDQSLVNQLIEAGQLTEEEAETFEHSNIILQALGTTEEVSVDLTFLELRQGDRLLLCSDGLSGLVHADMIREVLTEMKSQPEAAAKLIEMANAGGGHDNITCVIADFEGPGLAPKDGVKSCYQQYPLPIVEEEEETTGRGRELSMKDGGSKPGADVKRAIERETWDAEEDAGGFPTWAAVALLVIVAVGAYFLFRTPNDAASSTPDAGQATTATPPTPAPDAAVDTEPVEVRVASDVLGGELFIDNESYGPFVDGEDVYVELSPGAYRFEARVGESVVARALITVRPNVPADVELLVPAGATAVPEGADAGAHGGSDAATGAHAVDDQPTTDHATTPTMTETTTPTMTETTPTTTMTATTMTATTMTATTMTATTMTARTPTTTETAPTTRTTTTTPTMAETTTTPTTMTTTARTPTPTTTETTPPTTTPTTMATTTMATTTMATTTMTTTTMTTTMHAAAATEEQGSPPLPPNPF